MTPLTPEQLDEFATWLYSRPDWLSQLCAAQTTALARLRRGEISLEEFWTIARELMPDEFWTGLAELQVTDDA